MVTVPSLD